MTDEQRKKHFDSVDKLQMLHEGFLGPSVRRGQPSELSTARRKLWCDVWVARAGQISIPSATKWADAAVKDFDERFVPLVIPEEKAPT